MDPTLAWKPRLERQAVMSKKSDEVVVIGAGMVGLLQQHVLQNLVLKLEFLKRAHSLAENVEP